MLSAMLGSLNMNGVMPALLLCFCRKVSLQQTSLEPTSFAITPQTQVFKTSESARHHDVDARNGKLHPPPFSRTT